EPHSAQLVGRRLRPIILRGLEASLVSAVHRSHRPQATALRADRRVMRSALARRLAAVVALGVLATAVALSATLVSPAPAVAASQAKAGASPRAIFKDGVSKFRRQSTLMRRELAANPTQLLDWMEDTDVVFVLGKKMAKSANKAREDLRAVNEKKLGPSQKKGRRLALLAFKNIARLGAGMFRNAEVMRAIETGRHDQDRDGVTTLDDPDELLEVQKDLRAVLKDMKKHRDRIAGLLVLTNKTLGKPVKPAKLKKAARGLPTPSPKTKLVAGGNAGGSHLIEGLWNTGGDGRIRIVAESDRTFALVGKATVYSGGAARCGDTPTIQWWMNPTDEPTTYEGQILWWDGCTQITPDDPSSEAVWTVSADGQTGALLWGGREFPITRVG
ncbi:MAG: hypothetical protein ACR2OD_06820, partial [Gaiellaceae bacterium]